MTQSGCNIFKFETEVEDEMHLLCEIALDLTLALRAGKLTYQFRHVGVGTTITALEELDFVVEAFLEEERPEHLESCDVAWTVFRALVRSQNLGSRPNLLLAKAVVVGCQGPLVELELGYDSPDLAAGSPRGHGATQRIPSDIALFHRSKNIVERRRIVHEL